jgi:hypothetical protein
MGVDENGRGALGGGRGDSGRSPEERFGSEDILEPGETRGDQEASADVDDEHESDQESLDYQPDHLDAAPSDATDVDEIDWPALWGLAGIGADQRISQTQAALAVETSDQTGVRSTDGAAELVAQAVEQGLLVGRRHDGAVVQVQLAPHLLEGDR